MRYEDFLADKERAFQPRGDRSVTPEAFFGDRNLRRVLEACQDRMSRLGYDV